MVFPRSLIPKGTGVPDFQSKVQQVTGSLSVVGSLQHIRTLGTVQYVREVGTLRNLGTMRYLRAGSLGRVERVGTVGRITSLGTVRTRIAAQDITTAVDIQARLQSGTVMRDRRPLGPGSVWAGSWQDITDYFQKTYIARAIGSAGSLYIILGATGTGPTHATGTLSSTRVGAGSYVPVSFTHAVQFTRPVLRAAGAAQNARGSFTVALARQT